MSKDESELFTLTPRGNKHAWLIYGDKGRGEPIALLKVPIDEFWDKLGKGLGIKFVYPQSG